VNTFAPAVGATADDAETGESQRGEPETQSEAAEDIDPVGDDVDVHRRPGVAGALQRPRGDERDVAGGRGGEDDGEIRRAECDDLVAGSEQPDGWAAEEDAEQHERDTEQEAQQDALGDGLVPVRLGGSAGVLTRQRDGAATEPQSDAEWEPGVQICEADGDDARGVERRGDDDVDGPHQRAERLLGHHRPREREHPLPDGANAGPVHGRS